MKPHLHLTIFAILLTVFVTSSFFTTKHPNFIGVPPSGLTGFTASYCTNCHGGFPLNNAGGSVQVTGLPTTVTAGLGYTFSLTTSHINSDRGRWGFSIVAKNSAGENIGTFSSNNINAAPNTNDINELSHNNAVSTALTNTFTYSNLVWTAPATLGANDGQVTFYYTGNAANGDGGTGGDYIYTGSQTSSAVLPVTLSSFDIQKDNKSLLLKWRTEFEMNTDYFSLERSSNGINFKEIGRVAAAGFSNLGRDYTYNDNSTTDLKGTVYYRLVTVDVDGSKQLSTIKKIALAGNEIFISNVYPTIAKAGAIVSYNIQSAKKQLATISLILADGKMLHSNTITVSTGIAVYKTILPANASTGMVYLSVMMDGKRQQVPISVY